MTNLVVVSVLLAYEVPLVVIAEDKKSKKFLGVNYADGESANLFYFARMSDDALSQLTLQKVDVRYAVTKLKSGFYHYGELWGEVGDAVKTEAKNEIDPHILPQSGMFIPEEVWGGEHAGCRTVSIDGRWGIEDLRRFSDLVQDAYAFVYALSGRGSGTTKQKMSALFRKYPWRGGFSSVNFFDDLYKIIPPPERADVRKIAYASPGTIELRMDGDVADSIRAFVDNINAPESATAAVYSQTRDFLRGKGWLGRAKEDLELLEQDKELLMSYVGMLSRCFGLAEQADDIVRFANSDPLGAVKILLAYYRRLSGLADYVATGKAQDLFK